MNNNEKVKLFFEDCRLLCLIVHFLFKVKCLPTLPVQYDKRMDDEFQGAKRKIKLVHEEVNVLLLQRSYRKHSVWKHHKLA